MPAIDPPETPSPSVAPDARAATAEVDRKGGANRGGGGSVEILFSAAGWMLLGTLAYAPWATACTQPWAIRGLYLGCAAIAIVWLAGCFVGRRCPRLPAAPCLVAIAILLVQGAWMTVNAHSWYDFAGGRFVPARPLAARLPGSLDRATSADALAGVAGFALALTVAAELSIRAHWRRRIAWTVALVGASVAAAGILAKARVIPPLASQPGFEEAVFATFDVHTTAGAFLNLSLPMAVGLTVCAARGGNRTRLLVTAAVAFVIVAAVYINISKAAAAICTVGAICASAAIVRRAVRFERRWLILGTLALAALAVLVATVGHGGALRRSTQLAGALNERNGRLLMWRVAWGVGADAGPFGKGPGTFKLLLPHAPPRLLRPLYPSWVVRAHRPGDAVSMWSHAHNDYLQALVEWGWVGAAAWIVILLGGPIRAVHRLWRQGGEVAGRRRTLLLAAVVALAGVLLHAMVDWPLQQVAVRHTVAVLLGMTWAAKASPPHDDDEEADDISCASC